jgi:hypothetical protein
MRRLNPIEVAHRVSYACELVRHSAAALELEHSPLRAALEEAAARLTALVEQARDTAAHRSGDPN